jgi:hypothetical protein
MNEINRRLLIKFNTLEKLRENIFDSIDSIDLETLLLKPAEDKWSILQLIFHLVKTEQVSIISIQNNLKRTGEIGEAGFGAKLRAALLILAMKSSFKFKAPMILRKVPESYDPEELKKKWMRLRSGLKLILENIKPEETKKKLFHHPYSGNMNIFQALSFLKEHLHHHTKQIERIISYKQKITN